MEPPSEGPEKGPQTDSGRFPRDYISQLACERLGEVLEGTAGEKVTWVTSDCVTTATMTQ